MNRRRVLICLSIAVLDVGCAKWVGGLRKEFEQDRIDVPAYEPTFGGQATDAGFLDTPGYSKRSPASVGTGHESGQSMWAEPEQYQPTQNREFASSGPPSSDQYADFVPQTARKYSLGHRATKADFRDDKQNEGSLWASEGQTNYFFIKNKIKSVGDIVTVNVEDDIVKNTMAEIKKTLSNEEILSEISEAQKKLDAEHKTKIDAEIAALSKPVQPVDQAPAPAEKSPETATAESKAKAEQEEKQVKALRESVARKALWTDIDITSAVTIKPGETMMGEIIERFPNGNYKIRATKKVPYRDGHRVVSVVGIAKNGDISEDDKINSGKLYEYQLKAFR